jgi:energy-coupling factor transport system permease protein
MRVNAKPWVIWIGAAAILVMAARNPMYALIVLLVTVLMKATFGRPDREGDLPLWRLAVVFLFISAAYNALFVHVGETVLIRLPPWPLIGGPITLEAIVEGAANGLTLLTVLAVFAALSAIVPMSDLTRLMPAAFRDLGVVLLIAVNYVPETRRQLRRIRDAQAIRGHQVRGLRDWRPLVVPLLVGGLERAMHLSETMVARGYGSTADIDSRPVERILLVFGLLAGMGGWIVVIWRGWPGWLLFLAGVLATGLVVWARGRRAKRTAYTALTWRAVDYVLLLSAVLALLLVLLPWPFIDRSTLSYVPYPSLTLPTFDWLIGLALAGLALPAVYVTLHDALPGMSESS